MNLFSRYQNRRVSFHFLSIKKIVQIFFVAAKSKILIELMETSYYWNTPESVSAGIFDKSGKGFKLICRRINENIEIKGRSMKITDCDAEDNEEVSCFFLLKEN